jgi:glutamate synthase domain-containing protein 3
MHGGVIYLRGKFEPHTLAKEVDLHELTEKDYALIKKLVKEFCQDFDLDLDEVMKRDFIKLAPQSTRPYGSYYAY